MSFVVTGHSYYGRTDRVEGLGKVATRFWHFMGIPVFPRDSWWVTGESWSWTGGQFLDGSQVPLNARSVVLGYVRAWSVAGALVGLILANDHPRLFDEWIAFAIISAALAVVVFLPRFRNASPDAEERWRAFMTESGEP